MALHGVLRVAARRATKAGGPEVRQRRWAGGAAVVGAEVPGYAVQLEGVAGTRLLTILPVLQGRPGGAQGGTGEAAAAAIRAQRPRQVLVELCSKRYGDTLACAVLGLPLRPPPRVDFLGNIHGGLLAHELVPVLRAAREVGAAVVPIDRSVAATRSRVAQRLWHPKLLQGLLRYGATSLRIRASAAVPRDAEPLRKELEKSCPAAHQVLVEERCRYMAHVVRSAATPGADVVLVCGALHAAGVAEALRRRPAPQEADEVARICMRSAPLWPFYVILYGVLPVGIVFYAAFGAWTSFLAPSLEDAVAPEAAA